MTADPLSWLKPYVPHIPDEPDTPFVVVKWTDRTELWEKDSDGLWSNELEGTGSWSAVARNGRRLIPAKGEPSVIPLVPVPLSPPPEPPEGTVVVANDGVAWQNSAGGWRNPDAGPTIRMDWGELNADYGPLRVAVPLTDDERELVAEALRRLRNAAQAAGYPNGDEEMLALGALADRIARGETP